MEVIKEEGEQYEYPSRLLTAHDYTASWELFREAICTTTFQNKGKTPFPLLLWSLICLWSPLAASLASNTPHGVLGTWQPWLQQNYLALKWQSQDKGVLAFCGHLWGVMASVGCYIKMNASDADLLTAWIVCLCETKLPSWVFHANVDRSKLPTSMDQNEGHACGNPITLVLAIHIYLFGRICEVNYTLYSTYHLSYIFQHQQSLFISKGTLCSIHSKYIMRQEITTALNTYFLFILCMFFMAQINLDGFNLVYPNLTEFHWTSFRSAPLIFSFCILYTSSLYDLIFSHIQTWSSKSTTNHTNILKIIFLINIIIYIFIPDWK